jgi:hypothetical protein
MQPQQTQEIHGDVADFFFKSIKWSDLYFEHAHAKWGTRQSWNLEQSRTNAAKQEKTG